MEINAKTQLCGLLGNPVEHSLSPAIHNAAFEKLGLNFVYLAFRVEDIAGAIRGIRALGNRMRRAHDPWDRGAGTAGPGPRSESADEAACRGWPPQRGNAPPLDQEKRDPDSLHAAGNAPQGGGDLRPGRPAEPAPDGDGHRLQPAGDPTAPGGEGGGVPDYPGPRDVSPPGGGPVRALDATGRPGRSHAGRPGIPARMT